MDHIRLVEVATLGCGLESIAARRHKAVDVMRLAFKPDLAPSDVASDDSASLFSPCCCRRCHLSLDGSAIRIDRFLHGLSLLAVEVRTLGVDRHLVERLVADVNASERTEIQQSDVGVAHLLAEIVVI
jgi:hypothetical protein